MNEIVEIDVLVNSIKEICPDLAISQLTSFGEKPFESGVWRIWLDSNAKVYISIEVHSGMIFAIYGSKEFPNKYPIDAAKICDFLKDKIENK